MLRSAKFCSCIGKPVHALCACLGALGCHCQRCTKGVAANMLRFFNALAALFCIGAAVFAFVSNARRQRMNLVPCRGSRE